jgi:hypothetical protein
VECLEDFAAMKGEINEMTAAFLDFGQADGKAGESVGKL